VVFGGATGIGRAIVERLAKRGGRLIVVDRNEVELGKLGKIVADRVAFESCVADILDVEHMTGLAARIAGRDLD
jgi:short-subunit dehydrogenase